MKYKPHNNNQIQGKHENSKYAPEKMLPLVFRKMQVRATVRYSNAHASMAIIRKQNIPVLERLKRQAYEK